MDLGKINIGSGLMGHEIGRELSPETKASRAMARCILTGTASLVVTYLIWRAVGSITPEVPLVFCSTCLLVATISLMCTCAAVYRISRHALSIKNRVRVSVPVVIKPKKVETYSSDLLLAVSFDKSEGAWYQRN